MADKYIDSNAAGTDDGTSWTNAYPDFATAAASDAAGDVFYVASDHSETTAAAVTLAWAGTVAAPTRIICADKTSGSPPTTIATGAIVAVTGVNNLSLNGVSVYVYGVRFKAGDSTNAADISLSSSGEYIVYDNCAFELAGNATGSDITGGGVPCLINCTYKIANASSLFSPSAGFMRIVGLLIEGGGTTPTLLLDPTVNTVFEITGCDLSGLSASANICANSSQNVSVVLRNCKMPDSWSGSINSSTPSRGSVFEIYNCDSTDTQYRLQRKTQFGEVTHETTLVRTGGASNGTTTISWKMVSNADSEWSHQTLDSPEIVKWNETTGSAITATIEILRDSATNLTNKEIWLEVMYLGTSGYPLGSFVSDAAADYLATAADQTDSSETWTTTGMSNPNTQKLNVTFTPQEKGFIHATVKLAKASTTVYVDPMLTIT